MKSWLRRNNALARRVARDRSPVTLAIFGLAGRQFGDLDLDPELDFAKHGVETRSRPSHP